MAEKSSEDESVKQIPAEGAPIVRDGRLLYPVGKGVFRLGPFDPKAQITTYIYDGLTERGQR